MHINRLTIPFRLYAGFGIVLALGAALAGYGYWQLSRIDDRTTAMTNYATNSVRVLQTDRLLEGLRREKTKYHLDQDPAALQEFAAERAKAQELMEAAAAAAISPTRKQAYQELAVSIQKHGVDMQTFVLEVDATLHAKQKVFAAGDAASKAVADLVAPLETSDELPKAVAGAAAVNGVLALRMSGLRYLGDLYAKWL